MASILRTGKLLRHFAGFTRNALVHTIKDNETSKLLQAAPCMCTQYQSGFVKGIGSTVHTTADLNLERQLRQLDKDVRRIGRISRRDLEDVLEEIRSQRSATSSQSLMVIRCCGNLVPEELPEVRTALVQEIWKTLNSINVAMDISHYNALLRVYLENEHPFLPVEFLAELENKSIEPNRVTYQRLIARYCQEGDIDGATRILEHMRAKNLPVNEAVFNSLILGHSQANDLESAKGILTVMRQAGLEPSSETYATLLCCYAKHGDIAALTNLLNECEQKDILFIDKDLLDIIYQLTINGNGDQVDVLINKLHRSIGFNQECVNIILRLTNKGYDDVCLKLLKIMPRSHRPDGSLIDCGSFFIRQMVKAKWPIEKILHVCKTLEREGLHSKPLLLATEAGLVNGLVNGTVPLLKEMKTAGLPIRQHYFWPLFCAAEPKQIVDIIHTMQTEFDMPPSSETLRDYVIPYLKEKNWDKVLTFLRDAGIPGGTAAAATSYVALMNNEIDEAARIMESHRSMYSLLVFRQPLVQSLEKTQNYNAFVRCLRQLYESIQRRMAANGGEKAGEPVDEHDPEAMVEVEGESTVTIEKTNIPDVVGEMILDVASYYRYERVQVMEKLLPKLVQEGFTISNKHAERLSEKLGSHMTPTISELLGKLSSGELELIPVKYSNKKKSLEDLTIEELERFISNVEAKGEDSSFLKRYLLTANFRTKDLEKSLKALQRLEADNLTIGSGFQAQLINLYVHHDRLADALTTYEAVKTKEPTFQLDHLKTVGVVELLLKEERVEEALKFLQQNKRVEDATELDLNFNYTSKVWRVLNALADKGEADKLQTIFDALINLKYIVPNNIILGPLIKVHLVTDNIPKAIEKFEKICEEYKCTPWKNELARRLIQAEDAVNLQRVTDLSTNIHGEINSLYDLVFSFVECGRVRQARRILETPGLRTRSQRINSACEHYKNEGMIQPLEGLVEATKDLNHIDRNKIYYTLLLSYSKADDVDKALGLWTKMQEENVTPSDAFLIKLAELLEKKNITVPFVVPNKSESNFIGDAAAVTTSQKKESVSNDQQQNSTTAPAPNKQLLSFRRALRTGDIDTALHLKDQLTADQQPSITDVSYLIEHLVKANRLGEATKIVNELLAGNFTPLPRIFKFYLNRIANAGDVETIESVGQKLNNTQKRILSFDNRYCHANIMAGKVEEYFKKLYDAIKSVKTEEEAAKLAEKFPRGGAVGILDKHPELIPQYQQLAEMYAKYQQLGPINVLWMHLISHGDEIHSKAIWDKYLSSAPRLMFQRVLQTARETNDDQLVEKVLKQLRDSKISEGAIGNAYSCLIDIFITQKQYDKAVDAVNTAIKDISLEHINRTALQRLKMCLEEENKQFPFIMPEKKAKEMSSSSSSQSSDDDVQPKRPETRPTKPQQSKEMQEKAV